MPPDGEDTRWMCGRAGVVNLHRVSSIVREIREPCLHRSPAKGSRMLKPEKWQAIFDGDGRCLGFRKALKLIVLGQGVDPSIRAEVWEFLLGCYALSSTSEYRKQLRTARRERYEELVGQCQMMHPSVGTGNLAYVVGSKVMDMRTSSKDNDTREAASRSGRTSHDTDKLGSFSGLNDYTDKSYEQQRESSSDSAELVSARESSGSAIYSSSHAGPSSSEPYSCFSTGPGSTAHEDEYLTQGYFDFPPLPVTNLFQTGDNVGRGCEVHDGIPSTTEHSSEFEGDHMHSFHISNNVDLIMESNSSSCDIPLHSNCETEVVSSYVKHANGSKKLEYKAGIVNRLRISDVPEAEVLNTTTPNGLDMKEGRVSEWLWTLHRIVVDVVRTDSHLEFYGDSKNMARMSDILAVYAWVDPATGYCQGMSDLLSPFVVLYEDNADAFWCFEMLLRRMMEGPTGVMKQLQALWKIVELTDVEMYEHLSHIGAESLHFAFRMLLVLFRRELSFNEVLCMWEMMWAADFDEAVVHQLEANCLEPLVVHIPENSNVEPRADNSEHVKVNLKSTQTHHNKEEAFASYSNGLKSVSSHPLCGLTRANFWPRQIQLQACTVTASTRKVDDELPVFCVAAVLIINRQKIMRGTHSIDDVIKMFNDNMLKINVKRCIHMAIKLRKKYFYKLIKQTSLGSSEQRNEEHV